MIVLDTNVISELMRPRPAPAVVAWVAAQPRPTLYTTSITRAEILYGVAGLPAGRRRDAFGAVVAAIFAEEFAGRVLPFDGAEAEHYACSAWTAVHQAPAGRRDSGGEEGGSAHWPAPEDERSADCRGPRQDRGRRAGADCGKGLRGRCDDPSSTPHTIRHVRGATLTALCPWRGMMTR